MQEKYLKNTKRHENTVTSQMIVPESRRIETPCLLESGRGKTRVVFKRSSVKERGEITQGRGVTNTWYIVASQEQYKVTMKLIYFEEILRRNFWTSSSREVLCNKNI